MSVKISPLAILNRTNYTVRRFATRTMKHRVLATLLGALIATANAEEPTKKSAVPPPLLKAHEMSLLESIGIETVGGVFTAIIPRGAALGASETKIFSTYADNQAQITLHLFAGTEPLTSKNRPLGAYVISGFPAAPRGTPQIEIRFTAAKDGTLIITAKDKTSGKNVSVEHN